VGDETTEVAPRGGTNPAARRHVRVSPPARKEAAMRFIPTRVHGMLDYATGALLIALPYLLGFADGTAAQYIPQILGAGAILYAVFTDYELGLVRAMPMPVHLFLDVASGMLLAASPWLFGFADRVWVPHLVLGLFEIGAGLMTRTVPSTPAAAGEDRAALSRDV
jgi:hypothetical protein